MRWHLVKGGELAYALAVQLCLSGSCRIGICRAGFADLRMLWQDGGARTPLSAPANIGARRTLYGGEYYSGYDTGVITVWDADTGTLTQKQPSGMSWVVSPDGKWLAVLYLARGFLTGEYIIRIFSLPDFRESLRLPITGSFLHIQFSGDSQYLIVFREERPFGLEIQVLRTGDGSAQYRWSYVVGWVPRRTYVTPHHPDLVLAVGGVPVVYHLRTGERTYWQLYGSAYRADISTNGNYAIVCGQNLHLYRFPEGIREWSTDSNDGMRSVIDASFLADGAHVVSLEEDQTGTRRLVKRRVSDGTAVWATAHEYLHLRGCIVGSVAVTALYHGRTVVVSSPRGIWEHDVATGEIVRKWNGHQGFVQDICFTPDGTALVSGASGSCAGTIAMHEASTGQRLLLAEVPARVVEAVRYLPARNSLLTFEYDDREIPWRRVRLRNAIDGSLLQEVDSDYSSVPLAPSNDADTVVYRGALGWQEWDARTGSLVRLHMIPWNAQAVATWYRNTTNHLRFIAYATEEVGLIVDQHVRWTRNLSSVAWLTFSPDGRLIAAVQPHAELVHVLGVDGRHIWRLYAPWGVTKCFFTHDGAYLVALRRKLALTQELFVWRISDGALVDVLSVPDITQFALSPVDYRMAVGANPGDVALYTWTPPQPTTLRVNLLFEGRIGDPPARVSFQLRSMDGSPAGVMTAAVQPDRSVMLVPPREAKRFLLSLKLGSWLRRTVEVDLSQQTTVNLVLPNGDVDGDNEVTLFDFAALVQSFGCFDPHNGFSADLNRDGWVDLFDFAILVRNFGLVGDE